MAGQSLEAQLHDLVTPFVVPTGRKVSLGRGFDPGDHAPFKDNDAAKPLLEHAIAVLEELQDRLAAQKTYALLIVLQGMDASGKDGVVKHVLSGVNPQGVVVHAFKQPSEEELRHDFLWRHQVVLPERGQMGIFNRSHYEEVLTVRVHPELLERQLLPPGATRAGLWKRRYRDINDWERHLVDNGVRIVKLFLNVSRAEQRERLLARIDDPDKNWKFSPGDLLERDRWVAYRKAYSEMLSATSTQWAAWHVIPADHKWFARLAAAAAIVRELKAIDPRYPAVDDAQRKALRDARAQLEAEK